MKKYYNSPKIYSHALKHVALLQSTLPYGGNGGGGGIAGSKQANNNSLFNTFDSGDEEDTNTEK